MSRSIELTEEQYATVEAAARARGQTPADLLHEWVEELRDREREPRAFETDDWLRHLGVSESRIERANARLAEREARPAHADPR